MSCYNYVNGELNFIGLIWESTTPTLGSPYLVRMHNEDKNWSKQYRKQKTLYFNGAPRNRDVICYKDSFYVIFDFVCRRGKPTILLTLKRRSKLFASYYGKTPK